MCAVKIKNSGLQRKIYFQEHTYEALHLRFKQEFISGYLMRIMYNESEIYLKFMNFRIRISI